jgi:hypothetical protein
LSDEEYWQVLQAARPEKTEFFMVDSVGKRRLVIEFIIRDGQLKVMMNLQEGVREAVE